MSSLALYRTYRPGRFADVVGQEHVTGPLTRALARDRVHHAYLFSGPRGCGKTSSARILARSLNCEQGPTAEPCGECRSCEALAPNGPGSIDVVELDAATHGLVDDARELREKAHFSPVSSRFKIYIIDEAHQLGPGAANALLKLIEEPPAHLKFIFATTAPDKIIGTIRSRTHHYPFRLIPARTLQANLQRICELEGVAIEPAALALVARAAAGSARDAQSILGQLIAGSGDDGVTYDLAVALLGFTDAALLDQVVDAIAAHDGATVFTAIDRVVDSGHDPRRFLTDLLERFRDLIVVQAAPDAAAGLIEASPEETEQMARQADNFGRADLVRLADVVDEGITAMKGATPTRLQLELVCARLLLPGADDSLEGVQARLDRLERRPALAAPSQSASSQPSSGSPASAAPSQPTVSQPTSSQPAVSQPTSSQPAVSQPTPSQAPAQPAPSQPAPQPSAPATPSQPAPPPATPPPAAAESETPADVQSGHTVRDTPGEPRTMRPVDHEGDQPAAGGVYGIAEMRRMWPEVLNRLREIKRTPWSLISQESSVVDLSDGVLTLAFKQPTLRDTFIRRDDFQTNLRQAITDVLGIDVRVEAIVDPSIDPAATRLGQGPPLQQASNAGNDPSGASAGAGNSSPPARTTSAAANARAEIRATAKPNGTSSPQTTDSAPSTPPTDVDDDVDPNDRDLDDSGLSERELLERTLGATVIEEIDHS